MPRVNHVASARKAPGVCESCGLRIRAGTPYKYFAFFRGGKHLRHEACPNWKQSEMTGSGPLSSFYAACEDLEEAIDGWDGEDKAGLESILEDGAQAIRDAAQEFTDQADNMEEGFQHETEQSNQARENASEIESFADAVEGVAIDEFEFDEEEARKAAEAGALAGEAINTADIDAEVEEAREAARNDWAVDQREAAMAALGDQPL